MKHSKIIKNSKVSLVVIAFLSNATVSFAAPSDDVVTSENTKSGKNTKIVYHNARARNNASAGFNTKDNITARVNTRVRTNASAGFNTKDNTKARVTTRIRTKNTKQNQ